VIGDISAPASSGALIDEGSAGIGVRQVLRQWPIMVVLFVGAAALGLAYTNTRPVHYQSQAVVSFRPRPDEVNGRDLTSLLVQTYPELVASPESVDGAARAADVTVDQVQAGLSTQIAPQTLNLLIAVALSNPQSAQQATQYLTGVAVTAGSKDPFLEPVPVARADLSDSPVGIPRVVLDALVLLLSGALAVLAGMLLAQGSRGNRRRKARP
jgi:hypothetical protein